MEYCNLLKVDYLDTLRFKHLDGVRFVYDLSLSLSEEQSIRLLQHIRECLHEGSVTRNVDIGNYEVMLGTYNSLAFTISIMEMRGSMSRPLGTFKYDRYMGDKTILQGITSAIKQIESERAEE